MIIIPFIIFFLLVCIIAVKTNLQSNADYIDRDQDDHWE